MPVVLLMTQFNSIRLYFFLLMGYIFFMIAYPAYRIAGRGLRQMGARDVIRDGINNDDLYCTIADLLHT